MHRVNEPNLPCTVSHRQGVSSTTVAEETDTVEECAVGDPGGGEDDLLAGSEIAGRVNPLGIGNPHFLNPSLQLRRINPQASHHFTR